jgi:hypothetical protein
MGRPRNGAREEHVPLPDQALGPGTGEAGERGREVPVETLSRTIVRDGKAERPGRGTVHLYQALEGIRPVGLTSTSTSAWLK